MLRKFALVVTSLFVLSLTIGSQSVGAQVAKKPVIVFVHGAFQDASGWADVVKAVEAKGFTAITVQNAGHGDDKTPLAEINLNKYRDDVVAVIQKQDQPVILIGHSFGGIVISAVAEAIPEKIKSLVYLAAYYPRTGESLVTLSAQDKYSVLGKEGNFILAPDYSTASVNKAVFASAFCPDCSEAQLKTVAASQLDEPLAPLNEAVTLTDKNFGSVRKAYIMTAQDVVVSPQLQALMLSNTPADEVYAVNAGHAAYITVPDALASVLEKVAAQ